MAEFAHVEKKGKVPITSSKMLKLNCEKLHMIHHRTVLDYTQECAAIKI